MIPYPDVTSLPEELARAVGRMVRLVNEMRRRHPDLDTLALSTETALDREAATVLADWVECQGGNFRLMLSPWDGRQFLNGRSPFASAPQAASGAGAEEEPELS